VAEVQQSYEKHMKFWEESHKHIIMKNAGPDEPQTFEEIILKCTPEYRLNMDDLRESMIPRMGLAPAPKVEPKGKGKRTQKWAADKEEWKTDPKGTPKKLTKKEKELKRERKERRTRAAVAKLRTTTVGVRTAVAEPSTAAVPGPQRTPTATPTTCYSHSAIY